MKYKVNDTVKYVRCLHLFDSKKIFIGVISKICEDRYIVDNYMLSENKKKSDVIGFYILNKID